MQVKERCVQCLLDMQRARADKNNDAKKTEAYMAQVQDILDTRKPDSSAPYLVALFDGAYKQMFGHESSYAEIKKEYNDFVLDMEQDLERKMKENCKDDKALLAKAIAYARIGNYIDFAAMENVNKDEFLSLFDKAFLGDNDAETFESFFDECSKAGEFMLIADNAGEIVLDKLFVKALKKCFPELHVTVMVRGQEVLNDATMEDAIYAGMDQVADVISNGTPAAGTICSMMPEEAVRALEQADVVLSKGQGNFESLSDQGRHIYYSFLCKCDVFTLRFQVPKLTGMFVKDL